jgi:hypothetical protein
MRASLRALHKRCEQRLRDLPLPSPFDIQAFCQVVAQGRNRPIMLHAMSSGLGACGVWVASLTRDYIFYEEETGPLHQQHIILHELSHLLCSHTPTPVTDAEISEVLFPYLRPEVIRSLLRRAAYSTEEEQEAELLASLILGQVTAARFLGPEAAAPSADEFLGRLELALDGDHVNQGSVRSP